MGLCALLCELEGEHVTAVGFVNPFLSTLRCEMVRYCIYMFQSAHHRHLTRLSGQYRSDFPRNYIMGLHWRAPDWQEHLYWRHHTHTHTQGHTHCELGVQGAGSRLQTHNTAPLSFCYTILRPTLTAFPTFSLFRLTAHLSGTAIYFGSPVPAKYRLQCVEHITGRGPFETGCVLA